MNYFNRFLLAIYTLGVMVALFVLGLATAGWTAPINMLQLSLTRYNDRLIIGIVVAVFLVVSIKFLLHALSREAPLTQAVVHETNLGQVKISAEAIANIVTRVVNQVKGVREVIPRVVFSSEGINIFVKVSLMPETHIPHITDEIQSKLTNYMSEVAGINIKVVKILVESISSELKPGTPRKLM